MQLGQVFADRYRLEERLGSGAFGVVFAAFDQGLLQRRVAVKLLRGESEAAPPSEERTERFISELRLAGALRHPHIAAVHDAGIWDGQLYMVQELVHGVELGRFLAEHGPLSVSFALSLASQMLLAVGHAHDHGVLHRDLKPGNLLIDRDHRLVVVDFGLATSTGPTATDPGLVRPSVSGTPGYAAPEQVRGGGDARADQFSLAAVIYLMLTGVAPFLGKNLPETLRKTLLSEPDPPSRLRAEIPPGVDRALMRALSKRPDDRYPSLRAFADELAQHAAFTALASPGERWAALSEAARRGALVVVAGPEHGDWLAELRLPLAVVLGPARLPRDAQAGLVTDPRLEIYPSAAAPVLLSLTGDGAALGAASDGLRGALVTGCLLAVELSPDDPELRNLLAYVRGWAPSGGVAVFAVAPRWSLEDVRAAERRGVLLLEQTLERTRAELLAELAPKLIAAPRPLPARPYKYLSYFDDADELIFFGRDVEIARLTARILAWPVVLLYGASGAGKTSIIRAALAPRLARAGHRVLLARVFDDPLSEICRAAGVAVEPSEGRAARLAAFAREGQLAVVFLDQLEELWTRFPRPAREGVARALAEALALSGGHLRLVLCLRADYLARLSELASILPISLERGLYLEALSGPAARAAVVEPAALLGVGVEPALLDQMLADLAGEGVDPPQLQLICDALWEARSPAEPTLTLAAYRALGEASSILARHLGMALDGSPEVERARLRDVLKAMITAHDTRSVRRLSDISRVAGLEEDVARAQLDALARLRLVRPLERPDGVWYELTHEVLAVEIGRWLSEEDRRASQVRELLEQGVRGYDQLGLLLSQAQLALVTPFENRLILNEKERSLIARSRAALLIDRRRVVGIAALVLTLALAALVGGRALWLSSSRFVRATEGRLSWARWDEPAERVTSPVLVIRGAADPWWMDGLLGFPRDAYETDLVLTDLQPGVRDALRLGVDLPRGEAPDVWLTARLTPLAAARARFIAGDLRDGDRVLQALGQDPGTGPDEALKLAPVLALGEPAPDALVAPSLQIVVSRVAALRVPGGPDGLEDGFGAPLGLLLARVPVQIWGPQMDTLLEDRAGADLVGQLLALSAPAEAVQRLVPHLGDAESANVEASLRAISASGACTWLPEVRAVIGGTRQGLFLDQVIRPYLDLVKACRDPRDLPVLRGLLNATLSGELQVRWSYDVLYAIYRLDPAVARELLAAVGQRLRDSREVTLVPWAYLGAADMIALLEPGGPEQLQGRLYLGDPSAVWQALDYGLAAPAEPSRAAWLWPLALYRGSALQQAAISLLEGGGLTVAQTLPLQVLVARSGGDAAARAVGLGLASADTLPVQTALNQLSGWPSPLPADLGGASRQAALGRGVVALRRGQATDVDFLGVLADPQATALERVLAVEGQRRRWMVGPSQPAVDALRSPSRMIRLAATLALARRGDPLPVDPGDDPWLTATLARLRWLRHALSEDDRLRAQIREALDAGLARRAQQLTRLLRSEQGVAATVEAVLCPQLPGCYPVEIEDEAVYLGALADMGAGTPSTAEWLIAYVPPRLWARYATEPRLRDRSDLYSIGVLSGKIQALNVEKR